MNKIPYNAKVIVVLCLIGVATLYGYITRMNVKPLPADTSILGSGACGFPCWNGLTPGITTYQETQIKLGNITFLEQVSPIEHALKRKSGVMQKTLYFDMNAENQNQLWFWDDVLGRVLVYPNISFSIDDVVRLYGLPQGISVEKSQLTGNYDFKVYVRLYYPKIGLIVKFQIFKGSLAKIRYLRLKLDSPGVSFELYQPALDITSFLLPIYGEDDPSSSRFIYEQIIRNWTGSESLIDLDRDTIGGISEPYRIIPIPPLYIDRRN